MGLFVSERITEFEIHHGSRIHGCYLYVMWIWPNTWSFCVDSKCAVPVSESDVLSYAWKGLCQLIDRSCIPLCLLLSCSLSKNAVTMETKLAFKPLARLPLKEKLFWVSCLTGSPIWSWAETLHHLRWTIPSWGKEGWMGSWVKGVPRDSWAPRQSF